MKKNKLLPLFLMFFLLRCATQAPFVEMEDDFDFLTELQQKIEAQKGTLHTEDMTQFTAILDSLCDREINVAPHDSLEVLEKNIKNLGHLDMSVARHAADDKHNQLAISAQELKFRLLVKTQTRMREAYKQEETYTNVDVPSDGKKIRYNFTFDQKVSDMIPYIQANQRYSKTKTSILTDVINSLSQMDNPQDRKRGWLAIDRMLKETDIRNSESGNKFKQREADGIITKPGEILARLKSHLSNETDKEIIEYATPIVKRIAKETTTITVEKNTESEQQLESLPADKTIFTQMAIDWFDRGYDTPDNDLKILYYSKAIELDPHYAAAFNNRGTAYQDLHNSIKALYDFNKAIELDPQFAMAYNNRANNYLETAQYEKALTDYNRFLELNPQKAFAYNNRGTCYKNLGKMNDALRNYSQAIKLDPLYVPAFNNRGLIYRNMGKHQEAIIEFDKAIELDPQHAIAYNNRGISYRNTGRFNQALRDHQKAIEINPLYASAFYNLGCAHWELKNWNAVLAAWEQCLDIEPQHKMVLEWLPKAQKQAAKKRKQ